VRKERNVTSKRELKEKVEEYSTKIGKKKKLKGS